jgi:hypothetical protein
MSNSVVRKAGIRWNRRERDGWLTRGVTLRIHKAQEGVSRVQCLIALEVKPHGYVQVEGSHGKVL